MDAGLTQPAVGKEGRRVVGFSQQVGFRQEPI
jgi:hypothetical protein